MRSIGSRGGVRGGTRSPDEAPAKSGVPLANGSIAPGLRFAPSGLQEPAMKTKLSVKRGSGNVFADLGFARPEEELLKAQLVREIREILKRRKLTQAKAADLLGLKQPDVSLITGRVHKLSLERLLRCVRRLDRDVVMVIRPKRVATAAPRRRRSAPRKAIAA